MCKTRFKGLITHLSQLGRFHTSLEQRIHYRLADCLITFNNRHNDTIFVLKLFVVYIHWYKLNLILWLLRVIMICILVCHFHQYFIYFVAVNFIEWGIKSTDIRRRRVSFYHRQTLQPLLSLTNFITQGCMNILKQRTEVKP